jgi:hypothetical protein
MFTRENVISTIIGAVLIYVGFHALPHVKEHMDKSVYTITDNSQSSVTTKGECINGLYFVYGGGTT